MVFGAVGQWIDMARKRIVMGETEVRGAETIPAPVESSAVKFVDVPGFKVNRVNAGKGALRPELEAMVSRIVLPAEQIVPLFERLEQRLKLGDRRTEYGHILEALDEAEDCCRAANRLLVTTQVNRREWELENEGTLAVLRSEATRALQAEKASGERTKQITEGDITAKVAELFPDEYRVQAMRGEHLKRLTESIENLSEVWASRCRSLNTMLGKHRV
jgi:hypothetical protein